MTKNVKNAEHDQHQYTVIKPVVRWLFTMAFVAAVLASLKPFLISKMLSRAQAYSACGMLDNTIRQCRKAIFLDGKNTRAWNLMAESFQIQGDVEQAKNTYLAVINIDQNNRPAHFRVGMIFAMQEKYKRAIPYFEQLRRLGPETEAELAADPFPYYRSALDALLTCYEKTGQKQKAAAIINELAPDSATVAEHPSNRPQG